MDRDDPSNADICAIWIVGGVTNKRITVEWDCGTTELTKDEFLRAFSDGRIFSSVGISEIIVMSRILKRRQCCRHLNVVKEILVRLASKEENRAFATLMLNRDQVNTKRDLNKCRDIVYKTY